MILVLSQNDIEATTIEVTDWLDFYKADYIRMNGDDLLGRGAYQLGLDTSYLNIGTRTIALADIGVVWFRRWTSTDFSSYFQSPEQEDAQKDINEYLKKEYFATSKALFHVLKDKHWLTDVTFSTPEKFSLLQSARDCGMRIPETIICNNLSSLLTFERDYPNGVITKSISDVKSIRISGASYVPYTARISGKMQREETFHPILVQENIEKQFELRVFYLAGEMYAMAIFSQADSRTAQDFRRYNMDCPNRVVPYLLPEDIQNRLKELMDRAGLNCGSIDLIKSKNDDYFFLEINPVGQFGMVSHPCNYQLEKKVAQYLIEKDDEQ